MSALDKLKARLQALRAKTVANGCTEAEALAAAEKLVELLDRHDISLGDLDSRPGQCVRREVEVRRKQRQALSACVGAIADHCDCKVWGEKEPGGRVRHVFFGLPAGVEAACCLHDMVADALQTAWERHVAGQRVIRHGQDEKGAFLIGVAVAIADRLTFMKAERQAGDGRALVTARGALVDAEFARLDVGLRQGGASGKVLAAAAFDAGLAAGEGFSLPASPRRS